MLQNDEQNDHAPSLSYLLKMAFKNYEVVVQKYEKLLIETISLTVTVKDKLTTLPDQYEIEKIVNDFVQRAETRMKQQQDKLDISESIHKSEKEELIRQLNNNVKTLLMRLNAVIAWLSVVTIVGSAAFGYVELSMKTDLKKQTQQIIDTRGAINQKDVRLYIIDEKGVKRYIEVEHIHNSTVHSMNKE